MEKGFEPNECEGLGWIKGEVVKMSPENLSIPHLGWNDIEIKKDQFLFNDIRSLDYYFIHSYKVLPKDENSVVAIVNYGGDITASMRVDNIFTTQFHPEKSQESGLKLLKNYFG